MSAGLEAMNGYLARLPAGLESHSECTVRGSVVRSFLEGLPGHDAYQGVPAPLRAMVETPPLPGQWVPEVHASALMTFAAAQFFPGTTEYRRHLHDSNYALLDSFAYRMLFRLVPAARLLKQTAGRWAHFHRGTELLVVKQQVDRRSATANLHSPAHHVPPPVAEAYSMAFAAVLEISGEHEVRVDVEAVDPRNTRFQLRWA